MKDLIEARDESSLIFFKLSSNRLRPHREDTDTQLFKNLLHCLRGQTRNSNTNPLAMEAYERLIEDWNQVRIHKTSRPNMVLSNKELTLWFARVFEIVAFESSSYLNISLPITNLKPYLTGVGV